MAIYIGRRKLIVALGGANGLANRDAPAAKVGSIVTPWGNALALSASPDRRGNNYSRRDTPPSSSTGFAGTNSDDCA